MFGIVVMRNPRDIKIKRMSQTDLYFRKNTPGEPMYLKTSS